MAKLKKETQVKIVGPTKHKLKDNRTPKAVMDYRENVKKRSK